MTTRRRRWDVLLSAALFLLLALLIISKKPPFFCRFPVIFNKIKLAQNLLVLIYGIPKQTIKWEEI